MWLVFIIGMVVGLFWGFIIFYVVFANTFKYQMDQMAQELEELKQSKSPTDV